MLKINIQLFAHKKGMGSTKNGRDQKSDSESKTQCLKPQMVSTSSQK